MSDDEDFMMSDADSYEFEFESDEDAEMDQSESGEAADVGEPEDANSAEALYYAAKNVKQDDPDKAVELYGKIVALDVNGNAEYQFKALKQTLKLQYKLEQYDQFFATFQKLSEFPVDELQRNYVEDSLSRILDAYIGFPADLELRFLEMLTSKFELNDRVKVKIDLKRIQSLLELKKFDEVLKILKCLYKSLDSMSEVAKSTYLLELYSIEIQVYTETDNNTKLKELYNKTLSIQSTIPHPKINAIIKECGGKMYLRDENYDLATNEFYESFKNYDETGNHRKRINVLKYLIVSSILSNNEVNKFESQETQFFLKDSSILKYIKLLKNFETLDNEQFNVILNELLEIESADQTLVHHLLRIQKDLKLKLLVHYIKPFKRLSLNKLSDKLQLPISNIEDVLLSLKNNGELFNVKLDLIDGVIYNE